MRATIYYSEMIIQALNIIIIMGTHEPRLYRSCFIDPLKYGAWALTREWGMLRYIMLKPSPILLLYSTFYHDLHESVTLKGSDTDLMGELGRMVDEISTAHEYCPASE